LDGDTAISSVGLLVQLKGGKAATNGIHNSKRIAAEVKGRGAMVKLRA
jgi:hypothetical protein